MPKKSKKSRSVDPNLPDLETRKAYLQSIGMPSPYQGETTSSSSIDDSSSSPATNETDESNDNTARPVKAADGASTSDEITARPERAGDGASTSAYESFHDKNIARLERAGDDASTSAHQSVDEGKKNVNEAESPDVIVLSPDSGPERDSNTAITGEKSSVVTEALHSGYVTEVGNTSTTGTSVSSDKCYQNPYKGQVRADDKASGGLSPTQPPAKSAYKNISWTLRTPTSESAECGEDNEKLPITNRGTLVEGVKPINLDKDSSLPKYSDSEASSQRQKWEQETANREDESNRTDIKDSEYLGYSSPKTYPKHEQPTKCTPEKSVTPTETPRTITPMKCTPDKSSNEKGDKTVTPTKYTTAVSSRIITRSVTSAKGSPVVASQEKTRATKRTKCTTEVSSKITRSATSAKGSPVVSSIEKTTKTPTKYTTEVSSEERSTKPAKGSPEGLQKKGEKTRTPIKYKSEVQLKEKAKIATPTKRTPDTSSREKREKTVTTTKYIPETPSKERTKSITPTKCAPGVLPEARTTTPTKHTPEASPREKGKKTVTPIKYAPEALSKERKKTATPTKSMSEVSSNENKARTVTPSKRKPDVSSKGTKAETSIKGRPVASSREKYDKAEIPTKCIPEASTKGGEMRPKTPIKNTGEVQSREKVKKLVTPRKCTLEISCRGRGTGTVTPTKYDQGFDKGSAVKEQRQETATKHSRERVLRESERECETPASVKNRDKHGSSQDAIGNKDNGRSEPNLISFKEFKEALGVDRIQARGINSDAFENAVGVDKNSEDSLSPEPKPVLSTEEFLEALALAVDKLELNRVVSNEVKTETVVDPPATTEPSVPRITFEEFKNTLGTEKIPPTHSDDLDVFNKALEKLEAKRRRRVAFLVPNEPTPSTSRATPSPERQLDNEVSQNTESASNVNANLFGNTLTFEEFHIGLRTYGLLNPELLNFDVFDKALEDMEKTNSSQTTQGASNDSCRPSRLKESSESHSSDEDINRAIAASGLKTKRSRVVSSDDETEITLKSETQKISRTFLSNSSNLEESKQRAPVITDRIPEEDLYLSESTSKSTEASPEESSEKSSEHDLVSSESLVKSSESEASLVESMGKSPEEEVESSESAVKSTESEPSPEEFTGIHKESDHHKEADQVYEPERISGFETSWCETKSSVRKDSSESSEESELKSPKKRQRKSDRIASVAAKSVGKEHRSRTQSESDLRKRRPGDKDLIPRKKRYSDEH